MASFFAEFFGYLYGMKLSVVIVNYNVRYFLEQCLYAAKKACSSIEAEIFVVDNNSVDGSCQLVREKLPDIRLIENYDNKGFSKANNQAIRLAKGDYILLLNPDTIVEEDSLMKCLHFMDEHPEAGGLGVKMIDGKGRFLPESKRGLPTPLVAFYKIFGLSSLFSHSKRFARYYLGHLDKDQTHEVDVLAGAFMMLRRSVLNEIGLLDETFFMYGEDIDLSYRISQAGFKNYYFSGTTIIHYKGESTKKGSINYVKVFHQAMIIFARKHFSKGRADIFAMLINLAIYFRAFLAVLSRMTKAVFFSIIDILLIFIGFSWLLPYWEKLNYTPDFYPSTFLQLVVPIYILIWISGIWLAGGYDKPIKILPLFKGLLWGSIGILIFHSLAPESLRFSRVLILLGSAWAMINLLGSRYLLSHSNSRQARFAQNRAKRVVIISELNEATRISELIQHPCLKINIVGIIQPNRDHAATNFLGNLSQLEEIIRIHKIEELIFSATDLPSQQIIKTMLDLSKLNIEYKIAPPDSLSIIGSNSIDTTGHLYMVEMNVITKGSNLRRKRLFDMTTSLFLLITYPFIFWTIHNKTGFFTNILKVLFASKSWVGLTQNNKREAELPKIKAGVLSPADKLQDELSETEISKINMVYAKNYSITQDALIILQGWKNLGR